MHIHQISVFLENRIGQLAEITRLLADAGIDIGLTLIGMHLKKGAVPLRLEHKMIGNALVTAARTRPKFIGGVRAVYNQELL